MDALSRLLSLYPLRTALDVRCHFGAPWLLDHPGAAPGSAPYHLVVRGDALLDAAGQRDVPLRAGDIVMFPHGAAHQLHVSGEDGARAQPAAQSLPGEQVLRTLANGNSSNSSNSSNSGNGAHGGAVTDILCGEFHFDVHGGAALLATLPPVLIVRSADRPDTASLHQLIGMLQAEAETPRAGSAAILAQLSSALFALLIRAWLEQALTVPGLFAVLARPRLQPALQAMLATPEQPWSLEQLAALCHMSRATFARLFRQAADATPADVLMKIRMAQAARLLEQGRRSAGDVAEAVGYQSEAAFNRAFKRQHGVGPGAYRRQEK